ncbi:cytochrome b [Candidatus Methylospira mobilis]|uniref:Cytochrome b n=1 Tax=Candidatus Methylospira mobilis TaxID=1808979 RepID=A0A5Q0BKM0_9GAMM|nr:cytochrome b [Candidatus Methylospira mobilis]QFY42754.1 cytochrome b [Candidatus Methylospira mobilis]WNV04121.1 cytochrome b [Candidatus Methylospira mobilis]
MTIQDIKYPVSLRAVHWLMTAGFGLLFVTGPVMVDLAKDDPLRAILMNLHKSIGVLVLVFVGLRLFIRLRASVLPELPAEFEQWERELAHYAHRFLYVLMLVVPLSGWAVSDLHGRPVKLFGLVLPKLFPTIEGIGATPGFVHTVIAYAALAVIALHLAGILKHRYLDRQCVLKRMI